MFESFVNCIRKVFLVKVFANLWNDCICANFEKLLGVKICELYYKSFWKFFCLRKFVNVCSFVFANFYDLCWWWKCFRNVRDEMFCKIIFCCKGKKLYCVCERTHVIIMCWNVLFVWHILRNVARKFMEDTYSWVCAHNMFPQHSNNAWIHGASHGLNYFIGSTLRHRRYCNNSHHQHRLSNTTSTATPSCHQIPQLFLSER